jgi:hypothetical protein
MAAPRPSGRGHALFGSEMNNNLTTRNQLQHPMVSEHSRRISPPPNSDAAAGLRGRDQARK